MKKRLILIVPIILLCLIVFTKQTDAGYPTLNLTSDAKTISAGQKTQLKVCGVKASKIKWTSSNKNVATVSKKGVVTGVSTGKATIKGKYRGIEFKVKFTVIESEKYYNLLLAKDDNVSLYLEKIKNGKIYLKVKNKSKYDIYWGSDYTKFNGKTYYDDCTVIRVFSKTEHTYEHYVYEESIFDDIDYSFNGGKFQGQFSYHSDDGELPEQKLKFSKTIK